MTLLILIIVPAAFLTAVCLFAGYTFGICHLAYKILKNKKFEWDNVEYKLVPKTIPKKPFGDING